MIILTTTISKRYLYHSSLRPKILCSKFYTFGDQLFITNIIQLEITAFSFYTWKFSKFPLFILAILKQGKALFAAISTFVFMVGIQICMGPASIPIDVIFNLGLGFKRTFSSYTTLKTNHLSMVLGLCLQCYIFPGQYLRSARNCDSVMRLGIRESVSRGKGVQGL